MAKKRKKDKAEKEEYEFRPPEFDEKEFLRKELRDTKTALLTIAYAGVFGIIAGAISIASPSLVGVAFVAGIAGIVSLRYVYPIMKVDTSTFQKKNWAGNIGSFFFTFLAVWVLLLNMPFSDHAEPTVDAVIVWVNNGSNVTGIEYKYVKAQGVYAWIPTDANYMLETMVRTTYAINITAKVTDNGKLNSVKIQIGSQSSPSHVMVSEGEHRFGHSMSAADAGSSSLIFYITAIDEVGNEVLFYPAKTIPMS